MNSMLEQENEFSTLDLHVEILRTVHHNPGIKFADIFKTATLAMDESSCKDVVNDLVTQNLLKITRGTYKITASGLSVLMPQMVITAFPSVKTSHVELSKPKKSVTLQITSKPSGVLVLLKNGVEFELSDEEQRQLFQKLERDFSF